MVNEKMKGFGNQGSAIRELFEYGRNRAKVVGKENVYDFTIGNPSVPVPQDYTDALISLLQDPSEVQNIHSYTTAVGSLEAREAIANQLNSKYSANVKADWIYLTCGAAAGLAITLKAITNPGDEVIVFAPYFAEYSVFIENAQAKKVVCPPDKDMLIDFDKLSSLITANTKAVIIDSPNNPTGVVYGEEVIQKLSDLLNEKQKEFGHDIYLLSDEPYRELVYSDKKYPFVTRYYDNSIVVYSFSKSLSLPGERFGYILLNPRMNEVKDVFGAVKGAGRLLGYVCAPSLFQHVTKYAVNMLSDMTTYRINRDLLYNGLTKIGYEAIYPEGAFYLFVKALEDDAVAFSERAKKYDLLLVPSDSFGVKGYVRLAYCCSTDMIERSMDLFKKLKKEYEE